MRIQPHFDGFSSYTPDQDADQKDDADDYGGIHNIGMHFHQISWHVMTKALDSRGAIVHYLNHGFVDHRRFYEGRCSSC